MKGFTKLFYPLLFSAFFFVTPLAWSVEAGQYRFGAVPQFEQRKLFRIWRPILDELERRTGFSFDLVGSSKIPVFEQKYRVGLYDFVYMNPYHLVRAHDAQGYLPLIRDGERKLKGILVVLKDSPIKRIQELDGKRVAFPSPNALGASLLMRAELSKLHGVEVLPHYVQTHTSVYLHVTLGLDSAGGGVLSTLYAQKPEIKDKLRIIYETRPVNPHPISAHPRVPEAHREKVRRAFLEMAQTEKGAALLAKIPMGKALAASLEDYAPMRTWGLDEFYVKGIKSTESTIDEKERSNTRD
jgi:phosphonate transport system substrate-binding protein